MNKKVIIAIRGNTVGPIAIPEGIEVEIFDFNDKTMIVKSVYEKDTTENKVNYLSFGNSEDPSDEYLKAAYES